MFVGGFIIGYIRGWKLALVMTATLPALAAAGYFMMIMITTAGDAARKAYGDAGAVVEESLSNMRTVASFGAEKKSLSRYCGALDKNQSRKALLGKATGMGAVFGIMFMTYALGFWYGGKLVADSLVAGCTPTCVTDCPSDCFYGGDALSVFFSIVIAAFALGQAGPNFSAMVKAYAGANDLIELIDRKSSIDPYSKEGIKSGELRGDIEFKDVKFAYPTRSGVPVFETLNLKIKAGETVAFVGSSGCGKSTTIQLIQRFYDVDDGAVLIDGADVRDYNLQWLRNQVAMVTQEPRLFDDTIAENIRYGRLDAAKEEVESAAKSANADKFIQDFPDKYDTQVGEAGGQLSGGQKQRVAIARAVIRNPKILILDEATSALDNESERIVQMTLDKLIKETKRTTIIIAHRLSTVRNADRIIVLDNTNGDGSAVVEQGTHDELMAVDNGLYYNLVKGQEMNMEDAEEAGVIQKLTSQLSFAKKDDNLQRKVSLAKLSSKYSLVALEGEQTKASFIESARLSGIMETPTKKWWKREKKIETVEEKPAPSFYRVMSCIRDDWWKLIVGSLGALVNGATFPIFAVIFAQFISVYFSPDPDYIRQKSAFWSGIFVALAISVLLSSTTQYFFFEWAGQLLVRKLREDTFDSLLHQEIAYFDESQNSTGSLSSLLSSDIMLIKGWISDNTGIIVQNFATLLYAIIIAFVASPELAGVVLAAFFVLMPASYLEMKAMKGSSDTIGSAAETPGYVLGETVSNIRVVTSFCLHTEMRDNYRKVLNTGYKLGRRNALVFGLFFGFSQFAQYEVQAFAYWYGSKLLEEGKITDVSKMLMAIFALIFAAMGFGQTAVFATDSSKAKEASRNVYYVLDRVSKIDSRRPDGEEISVKGDIKVDRINFTYPQRPDTSVYKNLSFSVTPGTTVALVGESGCGKSTVVQLLERFYDVNNGLSGRDGGIAVDDCDVRDHRISSLRSQIGLVSQEPVLFDTTIRENILYGRVDANDEEITEAAKMANAHSFIMDFPDGYDTRVGKGGGKLSGGQKQRVAIARAMLRDPKILLLDEATSALDSESERVVQQALDELLAKKKRTTLVIAHRLSTIKGADQIVVLSNEDKLGSVVAEKGTHSELIAKNGIYAKLVKIAAAAGDTAE
eukprot:Lankesteria_metandrocarpae@DN5386_c0_g1_i1.p1